MLSVCKTQIIKYNILISCKSYAVYISAMYYNSIVVVSNGTIILYKHFFGLAVLARAIL